MDVSHPLLDPPELEVEVQRTLQAIMQAGPGLAAKRSATLSHLSSLRTQIQEETAVWPEVLPKHVASAYTSDGDKIVQIPMLMRLLRGCVATCALVSHLQVSSHAHRAGIRELMIGMSSQSLSESLQNSIDCTYDPECPVAGDATRSFAGAR